MFSVRSIAMSAALAAALVAAPVTAGVIIKSSGPSAGQYPVGKKLSDTGRVTLKAGDSITILANGGTRVIKGPGTHRVAARSSSKRNTFAALTRQRSNARVRTGATRAPAIGAGPDNLWMVDVTKSGTMCISDPSAIQIWRPGFEQPATYVLSHSDSAAHVHIAFGSKEMAVAWDTARMPLTDGATYTIASPSGGEPARVTFVEIGAAPATPEDLAGVLLEKGCNGQLDLLAEKMM